MNRYTFILTGLGIILITACNTHGNKQVDPVIISHQPSPDTLKKITTEDIKNRILNDFGEKAGEATKILEEAISRNDYLNEDRIIRCIVFLSEKKLDSLKKRINQAIEDPRDVMLWAEYINLSDKENPKRVRDFNKTFQDSEKDVHE